MTEDDVIEHLLMRLNTDFVQCCLDVRGFCATPSSHDLIDRKMVKKVISKMYEHDVAMHCTGDDQPIETIEVTTKGIKVYENGGWKKYLLEFEKQKTEEQNKKEQSSITNFGNMVVGNNNTQINQGKSFLDALPSLNEKNTSNEIKKYSIWKYVKEYTEIISWIAGILGTILAFVAWFLSK
jgi:hypothetical protein